MNAIPSIKTALFYQYIIGNCSYTGDIFCLTDWLLYKDRDEREQSSPLRDNNSLCLLLVEEMFYRTSITEVVDLYYLWDRLAIITSFLSLVEQKELADFLATIRVEQLTKELIL